MSDLTALARRAVACNAWRWLPGMLATCPPTCPAGGERAHDEPRDTWARRILTYRGGGPLGTVEGDGCCGDSGDAAPGADWLPVLTDPATLWLLLELARAKWGTTAHLVRLHTNVDDGKGGTEPACWWALAVGLASVPLLHWSDDVAGPRGRHLCGPTEADALVAALEAVCDAAVERAREWAPLLMAFRHDEDEGGG